MKLESVNYNRTQVKEVYENTYANKVKSISEIKDEHISTEIRFKNILKTFHIQNIKQYSLLDIACGDGVKTNAISQFFKHTLGVDFSKNAIDQCNTKFKSKALYFKELDIDKETLEERFEFISSFGNSTFNVSDMDKLAHEVVNLYKKFAKEQATMLIGSFTDFSGKAPSGWYNLTVSELQEIQEKIKSLSGLKCGVYFPHTDPKNYLSGDLKYTIKETLRIFTQKRRYYYLVLTSLK